MSIVSSLLPLKYTNFPDGELIAQSSLFHLSISPLKQYPNGEWLSLWRLSMIGESLSRTAVSQADAKKAGEAALLERIKRISYSYEPLPMCQLPEQGCVTKHQ